METLREFLDTPKGKAAAGLLIVVALAAAYYSYRGSLGAGEAARLSSRRLMVCSETLKPFEITIREGTQFPCKSPYSGRETGYPAELCFWTRDGRIKDKPTAVLLNSLVGKPDPTFCPDCGRLVVSRNPPPVAGRPPVTRDEHGRRGRSEEW
ncbi:MAG: hypothetical protein ACHRHE_21495 [Tepidisphaerales bacterium]